MLGKLKWIGLVLVLAMILIGPAAINIAQAEERAEVTVTVDGESCRCWRGVSEIEPEVFVPSTLYDPTGCGGFQDPKITMACEQALAGAEQGLEFVEGIYDARGK